MQIYRELSASGLFRSLFLFGLLAFIIYFIYQISENDKDAWLVSGVFALLSFSIHHKRLDLNFLKIHFTKWKYALLVEYLLISIPGIVCLMIHAHILQSISIVLINILLVNTSQHIRARNWNSLLQRLIPKSAFEWKAGVRRFFLLIIFLWTLAIGASFYLGTIPVLLLVLGILPITFYEYCEPESMIISFEKSTRKFLLKKMITHIVIWNTVTLPLIGLFIAIHTEFWYVPIIEYLMLTTLHVYLILMKYAFYKPNTKPYINSTLGGIGFLGAIIPVFIPLMWILTIIFYVKAKRKLNTYLYDFN